MDRQRSSKPLYAGSNPAEGISGSVTQLVEWRAFNPLVVGSSPTRFTYYVPVAQLVERGAHNALVVGSSPTGNTLKENDECKSVIHFLLMGYDMRNLTANNVKVSDK